MNEMLKSVTDRVVGKKIKEVKNEAIRADGGGDCVLSIVFEDDSCATMVVDEFIYFGEKSVGKWTSSDKAKMLREMGL